MTLIDLKHKLVDLRMSQSELTRIIERRFGERLASSELNNIMTGKQNGNKAERVKTEVEQILEELEKGGQRV